ncbi:MAG: hypothetical protein CMB80_20385 [Flammeovirgaceae bacterium]|nr:hypothetical protein [Flammeovirgaceae bacterium]MBE63130.1 hypothetical protein [Flammeovirgaceae bacterium]MBR08419.1 hypothetical protein [Rickettsiales bacterium]MBR11052.1 hypothetical protein [Rickettsiales bacterium]HCX22033.1 hypothetical protein [Cytophagales bacterium]
MLEYFKTILSKVSFDRWLFEKELKKAIKSLVPDEIRTLRDWCYDQFGQIYESILDKCFTRALA